VDGCHRLWRTWSFGQSSIIKRAMEDANKLGQGIQYAKAMGLKVIGLDISDVQLETAKASGADHVFNAITDKDYVKKVIELTGGGVDAAVNFTASKKVCNAKKCIY
jgi:D-arabinose 1-dehydrogenase-like Zn-dependent alcohol dehydrogenase